MPRRLLSVSLLLAATLLPLVGATKGTDVQIPYRFDLVANKDPLPHAQKMMVVVFEDGG
jgi:hypothetical protein